MKPMKLTLLIFSLFVLVCLTEKVYSQALPNFGTEKPKKAAAKTEAKSDESEYPGINDFVPVDAQPAVVKRASTSYPELAKNARIEGNVYLKVLVDKDGKPKKAVVFKSDAEVFNQSAIDSALKSTYTAATSDGNPVACWLVVPYSFKLK
jgi:protein TonB